MLPREREKKKIWCLEKGRLTAVMGERETNKEEVVGAEEIATKAS